MGRVYLYCIVEGAAQGDLNIVGLDDQTKIRLVANHELEAVVSDHAGEDLAGLPKEALLRRLLAHQRVVEQVLEHGNVLPIKFGTLLDDHQELCDLLSQASPQLLSALSSIRGRVEMEVAATWDSQLVLKQIAQGTAVAQARQTVAAKGRPTVEERIQLGQMVKACLDQRRESYRTIMMDFVKPVALDLVPNALLSDEMVTNVAFLIERARISEFETRIEQLDRLFQNEITFRVIGPLPPYSFSTAEISHLTGEEIGMARQILGLEGAFSDAEVRGAYRRQLVQLQPGLAAGEALAQAGLTQLRRASDLLLRCCAAQPIRHQAAKDWPQFPAQDQWVVTIRRAQAEEVDSARFGGGR